MWKEQAWSRRKWCPHWFVPVARKVGLHDEHAEVGVGCLRTCRADFARRRALQMLVPRRSRCRPAWPSPEGLRRRAVVPWRKTGSTTLTLEIGGHQRTVIVHVPAGYNSSRGVALVLNLHGSGSTAAAQEVFSGMDATSDQGSFIVAYPQGLISSGTGFDWNIPGVPLFGGGNAPRGSANDVAFLTQLVPVLESKYCINPREVFATGMSGGGRMTSQLACDASTTIRSGRTGCRPSAPKPLPSHPSRADSRFPWDRRPGRPLRRQRPGVLDLFGPDCGSSLGGAGQVRKKGHDRTPLRVHAHQLPGLRWQRRRRAVQRHRRGP